jgi:hypothetical protein
MLDDNVIVDGLVSFGYEGVSVDRLSELATRLELDDWNGLEERLYDLYHRTNRVIRPNGDDRYAVSNLEWGRRLTGKTADEIERALDGKQ